ncbi:flagellar assembly protein FliW [Paenibacillus sp. Z6-24]
MSDSHINSNGPVVEQDSEFTFAKGIPGFQEVNKYVIVEYDNLFSVLQAVDQPEVGFIIVDPFQIHSDYQIELPEEVINELDITAEDQVVIRNIVSWHKDPEKRTVNLVAPLVFNLVNHQARQIILQNPAYMIRHPLQQSNLKGD